jgi:hypothetical protein
MSQNIFDLPTSVQELSVSNTGMANKGFMVVPFPIPILPDLN